MSQSLMSLGGAAFAFFALLRTKELLRLREREPWAFRAVLCGFLWVLFSLVNLLARGWDARSGHTLGAIPLLLVPLAGLAAGSFSSRRVIQFTAVAILASVAKGGWQFFAKGEPATAFLRNPIYLAYNLLPACIFFTERLLARNKSLTDRKISGGTALLSFVGIAFTLTRTALTAVLGYFCFRGYRAVSTQRGAKGIGLAIVLLLGAGVSAYRLIPPVREKVDRTFSATDPSREWRLRAWRHNWDLFVASPFFGTGAERNGIRPADMPEFRGHWAPDQLYFAHSVYLQALADSGLVGTILFFAFWIFLGLASPAIRPLLFAMAFAGLTENIFNNSKAAHALLFYALLTLAFERGRAEVPRGSA